MRKVHVYLFFSCLVPLMLFTGGVESPVRLLYYPMLALSIPVVNPSAHFQIALAFSVLYCLLPFDKGGEYPSYSVAVNVLSFLLIALATGRISDLLLEERESFRRSSDSYHGLTNALNLRVMNLQSKVDSLTEAYERAQEADRNKTRFISGISHEIRSPLSSIRSFSEILQNYADIDDDTREEFLGIINKESERLTQLTNEILDVVRMESGKVQWHMDAIDMRDVIGSAVRTVLPLAKSKGLLLETPLPETLPPVRGDGNKLVQVVLNLLNNAVKFTSHGKITVGVEEMPDELMTYVLDTGEGIYPEEKERIFEEFYRIGDDLTGRPKGSGLGLSISKKIVEGHGGRIWIESRLGKGSTFFFSLPKEPGMQKAEEDEYRFSKVDGSRILVLEDYMPMRRILRGALESLGFRTLGAESVGMALKIVKTGRPDEIILGFPKGDEHFDELRTYSRVQGIPLLLVSVVNDIKRGPQVAVNGYISSPFDISQITDTLQEVLSGETGRILIFSDDPEEARNLQFLIGAKGYGTEVVSDFDSIETSKPPDAIVLGTFPKEELYGIVDSLRGNEKTERIPLLLALDIYMMGIRGIGLGSSEYGNGLNKLLEGLKEMV
jgi:signal transduction histidine kinase/DNA-binding response OmpR family regulator